jgi:hypothetical protein
MTGVALALAASVAACGGESADQADPGGTQPVAVDADSGSGALGSGTSVPVGTTGGSSAGATEVDVCRLVPAADVRALLADAGPLTAISRPELIKVPHCEYVADGAGQQTVIYLTYAGDEASYDIQRENAVRTWPDTADLPGFAKAYGYEANSTVELMVGSDSWRLIAMNDVPGDTTRPVTSDEMVALAALVEQRLT